MYSISVDQDRGRLTLTIRGLWDPDTLARFRQDYESALTRLCAVKAAHHVLVDVSQSPLQPQDIIAGFQQMIQHSPRKAQRIAFLMGNNMIRLQTRRLSAVRDNIQTFDSLEDAEAWLNSPFDRAA